MSWNEPGDRDDKGKKKDPWGRQDDAEGPPNIDEALRQLQRKLRAVFGNVKGGGKDGFNPMGNRPNAQGSSFGIGLISIIALLIYLACGIYVVEPAEEAVVLRLGKYIRTEGPGPHWIAPFVESKQVLNVQEVKTIKNGGQMLTKDENIVSAEIAVQYRINNARDYLFNLVNPEKSLDQVSGSALRQVVGQSSLNEVLTSGRSEIGAEIHTQVQQTLNRYKAGLEISDLAMQQTKAPEEVKAAFDDAIKAQQDEERLVNEAQAYAHRIIPIAEGKAKRTFEESRAYKERVILEAEGKTAQFAKVLPEYQRAPKVTRDRLFIDTMQEVYTNTPKVLVDVSGGNNMIYIPLDKVIQNRSTPASTDSRPKEEDAANFSMSEKTNQDVVSMPRRATRRPSYDEMEQPNGDGT